MTNSVPLNLQNALDFALDATWQAGCITLGYYQTGVRPERKADNSPVTIADKLSEQKLRQLIESKWPTHGILGEEFSNKPSADGWSWTVDPIDGTKSFVQGVPLYSVLMALVDENLYPHVGVAHFPALNETIYAVRGGGTFHNGRRAHVSKQSTMKDAFLLMSDIDKFPGSDKQSAWERLQAATYTQRTWGDAYGYLLVATGRAEIMLDAKVEIYDCGPLQVIMEEAGGTFTDWKGTARIDGGESIATNGVLYPEVLRLLRGDSATS